MALLHGRAIGRDEMKRYDGYILRFINHEGGATQQESAKVYLAEEVDAEMKELKTDDGYLTDQNFWMEKEIARLRKALEDIIDMHNRCDWYNAGDAANTARMALADGKKK